ncbi:hypothetical protein QTO34_005526 [Cnephaeus nilssonii]|uniref:Uncharacterized protein n=1 Tax=Cnephaeus nilssonii TaxID=3371016 RepID=A0AA40HPD2_CNENI|nr:hypothetical protein QTO34_005526 [Eptesicus nilssonii]
MRVTSKALSLQSSTQVKVEQQVVEEDSFPMSSSEGPVSHTTEGQDRPEVSVATWVSGQPGPVDGHRRTPPLKPLRPHEPSTSKPEDLEPKEAEPKEAEPKAPAQEAEAAPPVTPEVHPEEQDAELEASPPPELSPPPAASPAAAVEPGRPQRKLRPQHRWMKNPPWSPWWLLPQRRSCLWRAQLKGPLLNVLTLSQRKNSFYPHLLIFSF